MDPDAALDRLRKAVDRLNALFDAADYDANEALDAAQDLTDAAGALDGWLTNGGFLPADWERK